MLSIVSSNWGTLVSAFLVTLECSILGLIGSCALGIIFALMEISPIKWVNAIGRIYVEVVRNIPLLVITMIFYVVIPKYVLPISGFAAGTIGLTIYTSAFIAETVRAGIEAISTGQMEGARSVGLTYFQAMIHIIFPQAIKVTIPPLGNQFINLVKNSSVLAFVSGFDLMYQGKLIAAATLDTFQTYFIIGIFYLIITMPLSYLMRYLEKRWQTA